MKIHLFHLYRNQSRFTSYRSSTYFLYETIQNESGREAGWEDAVGLEELTRIAGVTFVSVYLAISGCAIIKMSAALTYRLRAVVGKRLSRKKKEVRIFRLRQDGKKSLSFSIESSFHGIPANQLGSDHVSRQTRSRSVWKDERRCCGEMDIFSSSRAFFHIEFHSHTVEGNILFSVIVPRPINFSLS